MFMVKSGGRREAWVGRGKGPMLDPGENAGAESAEGRAATVKVNQPRLFDAACDFTGVDLIGWPGKEAACCRVRGIARRDDRIDKAAAHIQVVHRGWARQGAHTVDKLIVIEAGSNLRGLQVAGDQDTAGIGLNSLAKVVDHTGPIGLTAERSTGRDGRMGHGIASDGGIGRRAIDGLNGIRVVGDLHDGIGRPDVDPVDGAGIDLSTHVTCGWEASFADGCAERGGGGGCPIWIPQALHEPEASDGTIGADKEAVGGPANMDQSSMGQSGRWADGL